MAVVIPRTKSVTLDASVGKPMTLKIEEPGQVRELQLALNRALNTWRDDGPQWLYELSDVLDSYYGRP